MQEVMELSTYSNIDKLTQIFESNLEEIKRTSTADSIPNWKDYLSKDTLLSMINEEVPKNKTSNLSRCNIEVPGKEIKALVQEAYPDKFVWCSGYFYYPPTGYMGWHTNHDNPGIRIYITYSSEANKSFFKYYKDGEIVTDYDKKGITIRQFQCPGSRPYYWHCVGSECDRVSVGFTVKNYTKQLISPKTNYAIIKENKVINIIKWNGDTSIWQPPSGTIAVYIGDNNINIGTKYIDNHFIITSVTTADPKTIEL